jgi:hypothetical protein
MARVTDLQVPFHPRKDGLFVKAAHGLQVESIHHIVDLDGLPCANRSQMFSHDNYKEILFGIVYLETKHKTRVFGSESR